MKRIPYCVSLPECVCCACVALVCSLPLPSHAAAMDTPHKIGIEGMVVLDLPRSDYRPLPLDDRTEMILRIGTVTAITNDMYRYQLFYMGLEPGDYPLADFLVLPDGSQPVELADIPLQVRATLPEDHDGRLTNYVPEPFPFIGGYRVFLGALGGVWMGGIAVFIWSYRRRKVIVIPVEPVREPSFAELLQPLVEAAAMGQLSGDEKARLERLLMGYWRDQLHLPEARMAESLARLKAHAQAGQLLRALERWLHQRTGASAEEVNALLEPYRNLPTPAQTTGGSA